MHVVIAKPLRTFARHALVRHLPLLTRFAGRVDAQDPHFAREEAQLVKRQFHQRIVGMTALGRICQPEDVAGAVLFLAGDTSRYISGITLNVDGGV